MGIAFKTEGVVLKRVNYREADRLVTILTKKNGKITALAKGVRKVTSKKKGSLEPATHANFYFVKHRNWYVLTQTQLINPNARLQANLTRMTQAYQLLEVVNALTVEEDDQSGVFENLLSTLNELQEPGRKKQVMINSIHEMVSLMGFATKQELAEYELQDIIESLINRPLRSKKFLTIRTK